jgi:TolA protein
MSAAADARVWLDAANAPEEPDFDPQPASSMQRIPSRLRIALVLSLLAHGVLLSLALGGDALGLPGLSFPWKERRLGADDLRIVLAPVPVPAPVTPQSRSAPVVLPPPSPAPVTAAPARPKVDLPVAPDAPATRASADTVAPEPVAIADDTAQKQVEQEAKARAIEQARIEKQQDAQREAARLAAERQELARQEALRQEQVKAEATAQQEAARQEQARTEAARLEAERKEAARQEQAKQEQARQAQLEAARKEQAQLEAARKAQAQQETARQDALRQEAARQDAIRQAAARQDAANQEAARQAQAKQDQAQRERAEQEAKREERLRAIGQQMKQEALQRDAAPATSSLRRGWLFGRADANADLVEYAQAMSRKIEMNMTFDMVREAVKQPHAQPVVTVAVRADGSVEKVTFVVSSGVPAIDDAIRKVVESQAPYGRFPPALARQYDVVEIRRTWVFDMAIRLQ